MTLDGARPEPLLRGRPDWPAAGRALDAGTNVVAVGAAAGAYLLSAQAGVSHGTRRGVLLGVGAALAALVVVAGLVRQRRDARRVRSAADLAVDAEAALSDALSGALAPITSYLGELAVAGPRAARALVAGKLRQAVVDAAAQLCGEQTRSAFYRLDARAGLLTREAWAGRPTPPRPVFRGGTRDGDNVLAMVLAGDLLVVPDVAADPIVTPSTGDYRTVVAVTVVAGDRRIGMLTVDSPLLASLGGRDVELVRVLANLLGSGLAQAP